MHITNLRDVSERATVESVLRGGRDGAATVSLQLQLPVPDVRVARLQSLVNGPDVQEGEMQLHLALLGVRRPAL